MTLIWLGSLYGANSESTRHRSALGFISMFVSGGVSGFFLGRPSLDIVLHATIRGRPFPHVMGVASIFVSLPHVLLVRAK